MTISAIIPTFNRKEYLKKILINLTIQILPINIERLYIVVVVDGSTDGTIEMLEKEFPQVHIVNGNGNWWYTKSMNEGFKYSIEYINPDFVLTMNDDIEVERNYISSIINSYNSIEKNSIIGSVSFIKSKPLKIFTSGIINKNKYFGSMKSYLPIFKEVNIDDIKDKILISDVLPGRGMLIRTEVLKNLNLFDEKFKQYHSDVDFCLRAKKKGYNVYISWDAHVYVNEKATGAGTSFLKESFPRFISHFFRPTSRLYIKSQSRFIWRHGYKIMWAINMLLFVGVSFRNYFFKAKLSE